MGLLGNGSLLNKLPLTYVGAAAALGSGPMAAPVGDRLWTVYTAPNWDKKAGVPAGYASAGLRNSASWLPPLKAGAVAARLNTVFGASATVVAGRSFAASADAAFSADAEPRGTISSGGSASATFSASLTVAGTVFGAGSASATFSGVLAPSAIGWASGSASASFSASAQSGAVGWITGAITPFTELSPQNLAAAVGQRIIEAGLTQDDINRLVLAFVAGRATGLEGANPSFYAQDGTTVRFQGTYAAGDRTTSINKAD